MFQPITLKEKKMKKLLIFLTLFSSAAFAYPNFPGNYEFRDCRNSDQIGYQAQDLARETRDLLQRGGRGPRGNRFSDEARRLMRASMDLAQAARGRTNCRMLMRMFDERVEPAFRDLMAEARGPGRDDANDELRDIRRAFQDLRRELMDDDNGRGPRGPRGPWPIPGGGPGRGPWDDGRDDGRGPRH
jgi:hypothetical protein